MSSASPRSALLLATSLSLTVAALSAATPARAQASGTSLSSIERQIQALQAELKHMKQQAAQRDRELRDARQERAYTPPVSQAAPVMPQIPAGYALVPAAPGSSSGSVVLSRVETPPKMPPGTFQIGGVSVQLGGYIDASTIFRSRNEVTDLSSNFSSAIPFRNSPLYHENEFRETARGTRLSVAAMANPDENTKLRAFVAIDFQGGSPTSNSNQTNGFEPRIREGYFTYDRKDLGFEFLAGQTFTLLTMGKVGVDPALVNLPLTIDQNYVPGFTYARQSQVRFAKSFLQGQYWAAISFENPQAVYANATIPSALGSLNATNPGTGSLGTGSNTAVNACTAVTTTIVAGKATSVCTTSAATATGNFSNDVAPDVVAKLTADYNVAHFEGFGIGRVFHDRVSQLGTGQSNTEIGGGGGASALVHIIPKLLDAQVNGIIGTGLGRYGPAQLARLDHRIGRQACAAAGIPGAHRPHRPSRSEAGRVWLSRHRADPSPLLQRRERRQADSLWLRQPGLLERRLRSGALAVYRAVHREHVRHRAGHGWRLLQVPEGPIRHVPGWRAGTPTRIAACSRARAARRRRTRTSSC